MNKKSIQVRTRKDDWYFVCAVALKKSKRLGHKVYGIDAFGEMVEFYKKNNPNYV